MAHTSKFKKNRGIFSLLVSLAVILGVEFMFPQGNALAQVLPDRPLMPALVLSLQRVVPEVPMFFPQAAPRLARYVVRVPTTAYSSTVDQTDSTPFVTAMGTAVRPGVVAANFLPFGTKIRLPDHFGDQVFVVEDRMNARYTQRLDIWMDTRMAAKQWGVRHVKVEVL